MNLYMIKKDKLYKIENITAPLNIKDTFYSNGLLPGLTIKKVLKNIFNTSSIYNIDNKYLMIKDEYSKYVEVNPIE